MKNIFDSGAVQLVLGMQWGDEGKGKIVDLFSRHCDIVVRYQGGANAGHTVIFDDQQYILHLIPSGILRPHIQCVIGNGVVVDPDSLFSEIEALENQGFDVVSRLKISHAAHLILPVHKMLDQAKENGKTDKKIGTTGRGIGPAYADKANREGLRPCDILGEDWQENVREFIASKKPQLSLYSEADCRLDETLDILHRFREKLQSTVTDTRAYLYNQIKAGKKVLLEGAQGTLLDLDFGTYPYVTSSNTTIGGVYTGLGISPRMVDCHVGILKAYTTRVGNGPMPTELFDADGAALQKVGGEFGATTGRPRRCGWFDSVVARYSAEVNGIDGIVLTKMDVLDQFESIKICTGYRYKDDLLTTFNNDCSVLDAVEPVYETLPGWQCATKQIREYAQLPEAARAYVERIETLIQTPIHVVSVGPDRNATIKKT